MKKIFLHKYTIGLLLTILFFACSTEKNTFVNRNYHNLTAHYNVYFNGDEAMKAGLFKIETRVEEDYTKTLPVFKESLPGTETVVNSDMNVAIEKGTKLIKLHSITKPPVRDRNKDVRKRKPVKPEYNKWVDDAYIMMGKAYLYQKNYIMAASTFTHIIRRFKDEPVKYDAYLWLARTYNESGRYTEARELIETLEGDNNFPDHLEGELAIIAADLYLKQNRFDEAIQYLNIGIKKIKGNKRKTRYNYILAQLYQEQGNNQKALEAYQRVIRRRPDYEMLFNARINSASVFSGEGNVASLRNELNKMSKKKRNEPYLDQIYYALANILYREGRIDDAIKTYRKSAAVSVENTHQRALSCLTLADIYFDKRAYIPSGNYYDSAMVVIDEKYPNYKAIESKHVSLSRLVTNLVAVQTQDSLQHLASLSKEELNAKIDGWVAAEKKKVEEMDAAMASGDYAGAYGQAMSNRMRLNTQSGGGWYFYNPSTVSYGKQEFKRLWGDRKNEDHWRRIDKSISLIDEMGEPIDSLGFDDLIGEMEEQSADDPTTKEFYMKNIPTTDSSMAVSNSIIRDALFDAGIIFKTEFNDFERSIESFNELNRRYPGNIHELPGYFNLWDLYGIVQKPDSSILFKNRILDKYPESNYAKYLINPNYFIELEAKKDSMNQLYNQAFNFYRNRDFRNANQYSSMVLGMNPDSILISKARFIQMVSASRNFEQKRFADSLSAYIKVYPKAEPTPLAQQILALIKDEKLTDVNELVSTGYLSEVIKNLELIAASEQTDGSEAAKWDTDSDLLHYFVIAYPNNENIDANRLRFDIANYNIDHYTSLDFDIETETLNNETKLIVVRNFGNKEAALIYFLSIIRKPEVFKTLAGEKFLNFVISNNNFREMLSDQSHEQYLQYFVRNYSIFTTGEFPEEELDSPEQLMAKLNKDDELVEKGEFVLIDTDDGSYQAPEPKEDIFTLDYSSPHSYLIVIKDPRYRTGFIMRDLVRYNTDNHRDKRLRVIPGNLTDGTLLMVSSFENAYEASQYQRAANANKAMFETLGTTPYETFIISNVNYEKLRETNNLEAWNSFYRANFIQRKPPEPRSQIETPVETAPVQQPETKPTVDETPATVAEEVKIPVAETVKAEPEVIAPQEEQTVPVADTKVPTATQQVEPAKTPAEYSGPYTYQPETAHNLIYLLPSSGSNKTLLITYLNRLNAVSYRGTGIEVKELPFDDFRSLVVVSGLENKEKALEYIKSVDADSRIGMSLRNVNYKSYLITNTNLEQFKALKEINGYQVFYTTFY